MMSKEGETTYTLYGGARFILSGKKDTIKLYLRMRLDKWEDALISDKRNAMFVYDDKYAKEGVLELIEQDKNKAYEAWKMEMIAFKWHVEWSTGDGMYHVKDANKFFLEDIKI